MHILVDENIPQGREVFSAYGTVTTFHGRKLTAADVKAANADALLVRSITKVNAALLHGSNVKFVGTATIGVDHIDQPYLAANNIGFSAAPGCNARSVAEYFVAALLELRARNPRGPFADGFEGKTVGIVGHGNVGQRVEYITPAICLRALLCDPPRADAGHKGPYHTLEELAARCDILTFHAPLTKTGPHPTHGLADKAFFAALAERARRHGPVTLLNMGRGEVFEEAATRRARTDGTLAHLVLDVFPGEPDVSAGLLDDCDLATPHIAGYSIQGKLNGTTQIHDAFCAHFGLTKKSGVDYPQPDAPVFDFTRDFPASARHALTLDLVHAAVRHVYPIARDDAALRSGPRAGTPEFPVHFDVLRKAYPVRHEFAGYRVIGLPDTHAGFMARQMLKRLGFLTH